MRRKLTFFLVIIAVLSLITTGCTRKWTEMKVLSDAGGPVPGAQLIFMDKNGKEVERHTVDGTGRVLFEETDDVEYVKVIPPEGFEAVIPDYLQGVKISGPDKTSIIVLRYIPEIPDASDETYSEETVSPSTEKPSDTLIFTEPYILYPGNALTAFGYNPETETAALIKSYVDRDLLLLYKNSDGAARALVQFNTDQPALNAWINEAGAYQAYLVLTRTPDSILRKQQATVYSLDTEAWKANYTSTPPRSSAMKEFEHSFNELWVDKLDEMGSDMVAVWETFGGVLEVYDKGMSGGTTDIPEDTIPYDFIPLGPELGDIWAGYSQTESLDIIIDTPGGTQMSPGTEIAWYGSNAAILFVDKP